MREKGEGNRRPSWRSRVTPAQKGKCGAAEAAPHFLMCSPISLSHSEEHSRATGDLMNAIFKPLPAL